MKYEKIQRIIDLGAEIKERQIELAELIDSESSERAVVLMDEPQRKGRPPLEVAGIKVVVSDPKVKHPCCGSKQERHKKSCSSNDQDPEAEDLRCGNCEHKFSAVLLDAVCPECGGTDIYKQPE